MKSDFITEIETLDGSSNIHTDYIKSSSYGYYITGGNMKSDFITEYVVWVDGLEGGQFHSEECAEEVVIQHLKWGYTDVKIEEVEVDAETPEQTNAWLKDGGW